MPTLIDGSQLTGLGGHDAREPIAIVGLAGRFPGARDVSQLWANLCAGVESIESLSEAQLIAAGADRELRSNASHVPVRATADGLDRFDAAFFSVSPREAELMDPQLRLALETVWEALEDAGVDPARDGRGVGVFMGASLSSYLLHNLVPNRDLAAAAGAERVLILNDKDFYPTTISYRLDLRGPSVSIGTACSSSLVAVHVACESLLRDECRIAIAGGSSVHVPLGRGYVYTKEGIYSPDGHCRVFDVAAQGTVGADGAAFVVLKRYDDAVADRSQIYAVIRGTAINNDGGNKAGYTAPSLDGQSAVIQEALRRAGVRAGDIGYIEAHGTGTILGDPIEVSALTEAFRCHTSTTGYCALGSVKSNIGHLDAAAGVAGLIKATLIVRDGVIPPSVNFRDPNRHIDFAGGPFFVNTTTRRWPEQLQPRRAGVSAFGVGGTNVHVVLEEASPAPPRHLRARPCVVPLSARNPADFASAAARQADALTEHVALTDVEYTWARGRRAFESRRAIVASSRQELLVRLRAAVPARAAEGAKVSFLAPPASRRLPAVGRDLYAQEPQFRRVVEECVASLADPARARAVVRSFAQEETPTTSLDVVTLRSFVLQYALGRLLMHWGLRPDVMLGVEVGHLVVGTLGESLSLSDGLSLARDLAARQMTRQAMLVALPERQLAGMLPPQLTIVGVCAPQACVLAGPGDALSSWRRVFTRSGIACRRLGAVASAPAAGDTAARTITCRRPRLPMLCPESGKLLQPERAEDPRYWDPARPRVVRLDEALGTGAGERGAWVELGPGSVLAGLLRRNHLDRIERLPGLSERRPASELHRVLEWVAALWERGVQVAWDRFVEDRDGRVCSLPTYPFVSTRHWVDEPSRAALPTERPAAEAHEVLERVEREVERRDGPIKYLPAALTDDLNRLTADVAVSYLSSRDVRPGSSWTFAALADHLAVVAKFHPFLRYLLAVLQEERLVVAAGDTLSVAPNGWSPEPIGKRCDDLRARFPDFERLIGVVEHCARQLVDALTSEHGGLATLYPGGSDRLIRTLIDDMTGYGALPRCVELLCRWVADTFVTKFRRKVRILEVGIGGGILTWNLAPLLRGKNVEYVATDVSKAMIVEAEKRARHDGIAGMRFQTYDLRRPPTDQGLAPASFDLVLALEVLHVVPNLRQALAHVHSLMTPDGVLGVIESTRLDRWPNLIWGLSDGWWAFEDRDRVPLMPPDRWASAFAGAGFGCVTQAPSIGSGQADCTLFLAEADATEPRKSSDVVRVQAMEVPPKRPDIATWFYAPSWRPWTIPAPRSSSPGRWLLFAADDEVSESLEAQLRARGHDVVTARESGVYARLGSRSYRLRPDVPADYTTLIENVLADGRLDGIVHAWTVRPPSAGDLLDRIDEEQTLGVHSLISTMQALGRSNVMGTLRLGILSNNTQAVVGGDLVRPEQASLKSAAKIIPQEYPNVRCVHVDVDVREPLGPDGASELAAILESDTRERFVACRSRHWFRPEVEQVIVPEGLQVPLRERGVYLITGGLGGVGLTLAEHLARESRARLVLLGRVGLPPRSMWARLGQEQRAQGDVVRRIQHIESLGAEVWIASADLSDCRRTERVVQQAEAHFGPIEGVIHTAAVADTAGAIQRRCRAATDRAMAAKIQGALVLERVLRGRPLDFVVLCSALGATVYNLKFGEIGYVAANDFLNAFAHSLRGRGVAATTISWTDWQDVGMAADALKRLGQAREDVDYVEHPVWEHRKRADAQTQYVAAIHPAAQWWFYGHTIDGCPTLPGAGVIELMASAFSLEEGASGCEIRSLYIHAPLALEVWERAQLRLSLSDGRTDRVRCELTILHPDRRETTHATAAIGRLPATLPPPRVELDALQQRCTRTRRIEAGSHREGGAGIELDARWDAIREVWLGAGEGLARLELDPQFHNELRAFRWHPALLDSAVAFLNHVVADAGPPFMPMGYERIRVWAPLEPVVFSHGRWDVRSDRAGELLRFDFVVYDGAGRALLQIDGLTARRASRVLASTSRPADFTHRLAIGRPGALSTLGYERVVAPEPPPGHVEVEVLAAGLNFKEVLTALGLMKGRPSFGLECAGRVRRVGVGVTRVSPGRAVVVFGVGWTMPLACVPEEWLEAIPDTLELEAAATIPVAFTVAYHALMHVARLQPGESVLIHSACGGVGLAAIQIARRIGATILATAGTEDKRSYLRHLGVDLVSDSRSPAFVEDVVQWTEGRGVDVVLNSLSGELLAASFKALARRGRLVELGRRDLADNRSIGLQLLAGGAQYLPVSTDAEDPEFAAAWRQVAQLFRDGALMPLPYRTFTGNRVADVFEAMSRGEHIGKLVIVPDGEYPGVPSDARARPDDEVETVRTLVQGMNPSEGVEAFRRALASGRPEVLVSTQDLAVMLQQHDVVSELGHQAFWSARAAAANPRPVERPGLPAAIAPPDNGLDIAVSLAAIWRDLLGVADVRPDDDFFDLGGDSLVAIRLIERLQEVFDVEQSLAGIFEMSTFQQLTEWIAAARGRVASVQ